MITAYNNKIPFFSVIICTYNRVNVLGRALESLAAQTEKDWEAVIVDDGSYDYTYELAMDWCARHHNFRYLFHSNRGLSQSKNIGIKASTGFFVTFLDSDDEYKPDHLEIRKTLLAANPEVDFLHGGVEVKGDPYLPDVTRPGEKIHVDDCIVGGTIILKHEEAEIMGGFRDAGIASDLDFYERAQNRGLIIAKTSRKTYIYHRESEDSLTKMFMKKK